MRSYILVERPFPELACSLSRHARCSRFTDLRQAKGFKFEKFENGNNERFNQAATAQRDSQSSTGISLDQRPKKATSCISDAERGATSSRDRNVSGRVAY